MQVQSLAKRRIGANSSFMGAALYRPGQPTAESLARAFSIIDAADPGGNDDSPALRVARLLGSLFSELIGRGAEADPETAWDAALVTLAAIGQTIGSGGSDAVMADCAELAYGRLFPRRELQP